MVVDANGAAVDDAAGASDAVDGAPPVDDGIMVPLSAVVANGATVDDGIMIPMLVRGEDGTGGYRSMIPMVYRSTKDQSMVQVVQPSTTDRAMMLMVHQSTRRYP